MKVRLKSLFVPPALVFVAFMVVVTFSFFTSIATIKEEKEKIALEQMKLNESTILYRFDVYDELVRAGVGLFSASDNVTKQDWKNFVESTSVLDRYEGAQSVGYASIIKASEIDQFEANAKLNINSTYVVNPRIDSAVYAPVTYVEPENERNSRSYGFDMYTDPLRFKTMMTALDNDDVYVTEAVKLRFNATPEDQYGFLIYAPHYNKALGTDTIDQRRASAKGFVYAGFRAKAFLESTLGNLEEDYIGYEIVASSDNQPVSLYKSSNFADLETREVIRTTRKLTIKGAHWQINYIYDVPNDKLPAAIADRPVIIPIVGTIFALLISGFTYLLLAAKSNDFDLTKEREINDAKDSLLSIASHQLRTPATGVKQYLGLVLQGFVGDVSTQQQALLQKAYESNERQLKTINEVLYLARLDSGRIALGKSKVNIVDLINSIISEVGDSINENQHKVKIIKPKIKVIARADEHMLRMVIENIITNAIKYTKNKGKITITVKELKQQIVVKIQDSGVGIKEEDMEMLFKQFSRIPNELSKSVSGTGIGLYLANHLMQLHGGTIDVSSIYGKGTTFTLRFPKK